MVSGKLEALTFRTLNCVVVKISHIKRRYTTMNAESRRSHSPTYYVPNDDESTRVCKGAFLQDIC